MAIMGHSWFQKVHLMNMPRCLDSPTLGHNTWAALTLADMTPDQLSDIKRKIGLYSSPLQPDIQDIGLGMCRSCP